MIKSSAVCRRRRLWFQAPPNLQSQPALGDTTKRMSHVRHISQTQAVIFHMDVFDPFVVCEEKGSVPNWVQAELHQLLCQ
jgi:hypothetical protein